MRTPIITRRSLLATGAAAATVLSTAGLVGCGRAERGADNAAANAAATLPTYRPVELIPADLPGNEVVMPGYFSFPTSSKPAFSTPPASALEQVTISYPTYLPVPQTSQTNAIWNQIQTDLGTNLKLSPLPAGDYNAKVQTLLAGADLPDIMMLPTPAPELPKMLAKLFADLGPLLAGDKALTYPYLANIPTASWVPTVANGTIYSVPQPRSIIGGSIFIRPDLFASSGANPAPTNGEEFIAMLKALTNPGKKQYAFSNVPNMHTQLLAMMGGPNGWTETGGTFTHAYLSEQYKEALAKVAELVKAGYAHPSSAEASYTQHRDFFFAGSTALILDGYAAWDLFVRSMGGATNLALLVAPRFAGDGDAPQFAGRGYQALTVINKKLTGDKLAAALNVLNYLSAPIGSAEYVLRKFGVAGVNYNLENGFPVLTDKGKTDALDLQYIVDSPTVIGPSPKAEVEVQHAWHERVAKDLVKDPSVGLYSETASTKSTTIGRELSDVISGVSFGRNTLADFDAALARWRQAGGDKIAAEYGAAKANS